MFLNHFEDPDAAVGTLEVERREVAVVEPLGEHVECVVASDAVGVRDVFTRAAAEHEIWVPALV